MHNHLRQTGIGPFPRLGLSLQWRMIVEGLVQKILERLNRESNLNGRDALWRQVFSYREPWRRRLQMQTVRWWLLDLPVR